MVINLTVIMLIFAILVVFIILNKLGELKNNNELKTQFIILNCLLLLHIIMLILQIVFQNYGIKPIYFDYFVYISSTYIPVVLLNIALKFLNNNIKFIKYSWVVIIPTILLICLWTNDFHHLFYINYSTNLSESVAGPLLDIYAFYTYAVLGISIIIIFIASIRTSGFFSKQTFLIVLGILVPLIINILGFIKIIPMSIYVTPVLYIITFLCFYQAIFKYKALSITPIAFKTVINTMSDAFVVLSNDGTIADSNKTFNDIFKSFLTDEDKNVFNIIEKAKIADLGKLKNYISETRKNNNIITKQYKININGIEKHFDVDIHPIKANKGSEYVGTLLLFKDITQHKLDIKTIEEKQDVIVKQGQLVSIGELAGGVAHDINTPISAIKAGIQMLQEMYVPRDDTEKELLFRMSNCTEKIIKIVNSMRNQIRNLGSNEKINFKIADVINDIRIIAYNEIQKNKCELIVNIRDDVSVYGDPTKLSQVFTNLIINSIQAYNGAGGKIEIDISNIPNNMCIVKIRDYAGGIPDNIKNFVFKNILTTKGTKGTGLGLYLAYSVIKGEFSGDITFDSEVGKGTTFYITLNRINK